VQLPSGEIEIGQKLGRWITSGIECINLVKSEWNVGWACIAYVEGLGQRELRK